VYILDHVSLSSPYKEKYFEKICKENQNIYFTLYNFFFRKSCRLWDNVKNIFDSGRSQMTIWLIRIACLIPKATNTQSKYAVLIAFPLQQQLHDGTSVDSWPLKMGPIGSLETSVRKCRHTVRHGPEEQSSDAVRG
jgi:hypothetical protein